MLRGRLAPLPAMLSRTLAGNIVTIHFDVANSGWMSTNSEAQIGEGAVARRPAAGRCAVFVVPFSFVTFLLGLPARSCFGKGRHAKEK